MMQPDNERMLDKHVRQASTILVIQAENPDGDSLASSLALEDILSELGKQVRLYCPVQIPRHLRYLEGWDRVETDRMPVEFDLAIIVDTSSRALLERVIASPEAAKLKQYPVVVIDHHTNEYDLPFQSTLLNNPEAVATGEVIYELATALKWPLAQRSVEMLATSILYDSLGLTSEGTSARTVHILAELVERGVSLSALEARRRNMMKKPVEIVRYKARLMERIEYYEDNQIAAVTIPWDEIEEYSDLYNPSMLVLEEMRMTIGVKVTVAYKTYPDGKITGKIRTDHGYEVADKIAEHFGGGGHPYAAGFKLRDPGRDIRALIREFNEVTLKFVHQIEQDDAAA